MICQLGMSAALGPLTFGRRQRLAYLDVEGAEERNFSEETARAIDREAKSLVEEGQHRARAILTEHRATLDRVAALLQQKEVVSGDEIRSLSNAPLKPDDHPTTSP
jgi:cell division protease FtsH